MRNTREPASMKITWESLDIAVDAQTSGLWLWHCGQCAQGRFVVTKTVAFEAAQSHYASHVAGYI